MRIIYYYPGSLSHNGKKASVIRPFLVSEFLKRARNAEVVYGNTDKRLLRLRALCEVANESTEQDRYIYIDSSNMPLYLNETRKLKFLWILELQLLKRLKNKGYKLVLFYRDAYWRDRAFDKPFQISWWLKFLFAHIEWQLIKSNVDLLLLPTKGFGNILPKNKLRHLEFLPGIISPNQRNNKLVRFRSEKLEMLYVGGLLPPFYDICDILKLSRVSDSHLTICCRENEWASIKGNFSKAELKNVTIVHESSEDLANYYDNADLFVDLRKSSGYYLNAFPYKYIESISYEVPVLIYNRGESARIVRKNQWGKVVNDLQEAIEFIKVLQENRLDNQFRFSLTEHSYQARFFEMEKFLFEQ